jgi:hypothetical protein
MWSTRYSPPPPPILMKLGFSRQIFEKSQTSGFIKIRPMEAELFMQTDGQTVVTKLIIAFRNFAYAP